MHENGRAVERSALILVSDVSRLSKTATLSLLDLQDLDVNGKGKVTVDQVLGWTHHRHVFDTFC